MGPPASHLLTCASEALYVLLCRLLLALSSSARLFPLPRFSRTSFPVVLDVATLAAENRLDPLGVRDELVSLVFCERLA